MSNWSGNWQLTAATSTYEDLRASGQDNLFTLQEKKGTPGTYTVVPTSESMAPAWNGCVLQEQSGKPGPTLPWPLPAQPTKTHARAAGAYLRPVIEKRWPTDKRFERLEGKVLLKGVKKGIVLFKVEQGLADGRAFLMALLQEDLDGIASPGGSLVGTKNT